jgi:hypothetical protein
MDSALVSRQLAARLNVTFLADDEAATNAGLNNDLLVQPHAPTEFYWTGIVLQLIDHHTGANIDMRPKT